MNVLLRCNFIVIICTNFKIIISGKLKSTKEDCINFDEVKDSWLTVDNRRKPVIIPDNDNIFISPSIA